MGVQKLKKDCITCGYNTGENCKAMTKKINPCFAWGDEKEVQRREKEILDKNFMKLYEKGFNDIEIAEKLQTSASSVGAYRNELGLKKTGKRRKKPAGTGK